MDLHPSVDSDTFDEDEIQMVLEYGDVANKHGSAVRKVYGYLAVVLANDRVIAVYERDRINDVEFLTFDEIDQHPHFGHRAKERDLYDHELEEIVNNGVFYYNQHTWYYLGDVNGHLVKIVRSWNQLKSVYWYDENPRQWESRDSVTDTYMKRRHARKERSA